MPDRTAQRRTPKASGKSPNGRASAVGSIADQAQIAAEELAWVRTARTRAVMKQAALGDDPEKLYTNFEAGGEVLSFRAYIASCDAYRRGLKQVTAPAAWRLALKRLGDEPTTTEGDD